MQPLRTSVAAAVASSSFWVAAGIAIDAARRAEAVVIKRNVERLETLTPREREVLQHVARGRLNKQIAYDLGTVEKTIKFHRSAVMKKLGVRTVADLVRMTEKMALSK